LIRRELTDAQWRRIEQLVPGKKGDRGRAGEDSRRFVDAVLWLARELDTAPELLLSGEQEVLVEGIGRNRDLDTWRIPIAPSSFDQDTPRPTIAGLGDTAAVGGATPNK
jgi:hypothetical protein